jgi:anti-sigma factor RsiW
MLCPAVWWIGYEGVMTGQIIQMPSDEHRDIQSLLPWFLTGEMDQSERNRIQAHIDGCAQCNAELLSERRLARRITELAPSASMPDVERGWNLISRSLDREPPQSSMASGWFGRFWEARSWLGLAVAIQLCLLVVMGVALWRAELPPRYHALGSSMAGMDANVVVIFRPEISEREMRQILRSSGARLVGGPTVSDAYLLRVVPTTRAAVVARLRQESEVVLAEPIDGD